MFTYRIPARSPAPCRSVAGARSLVVAAKGYLTEEPVIDLSGPVGRIARYAWSDHYAALRLGLESVAEVLREHGWKARIASDDNAPVDRPAAPPAGTGWWGQTPHPLLPRPRPWALAGPRPTH